jgi:thiol-disulfide isomerase/thioredoxin
VTSAEMKRDRKRARRAERQAAEREAARRAQTKRRIRLAVIAVVVGAAVVGGAVLMVRGADASLGVPAAEASGESLPPYPADGAGDPAEGMAAPTVTGYDPDGGDVLLGAAGRPQAIGFMAHWCPHCQDEVPEIVEWVDGGNLPDGVDLVAVSSQHQPARPNWPPDAWLEREGWQGAILVDHDDTAAEAYEARGTPFWVFVDASGTVVARHPGRLTLDQLDAYIAAIDGG